MGLFFGPRASTRSTYVVPPSSFDGGRYNAVDLSRAEASLQKVAVWSAVDLIVSLVSELPVDVYRGSGAEQAQVRTPAWLLDPAGNGYGLEDWIAQLVTSWLLRGNAFGVVADRAPTGYPTAVELLHPDEVSVWLEDGEPVFAHRGQRIPPDDVFHRRVYPMPGYVLGMSPIAHHASTIGLGISATRFGEQWFEDGGHPSGLLTNTETDMTPDQARTAKQRFMAAIRGTREPVVLGRGWNYQQIQVSPNESQFLETQGYTAAECCRIFGPGIAEVLGYESGGSMTYSNVESRGTHLLVYTLNRWLRRVERVLTGMLPRGQFARINRDALLQSTTLTRFRAHQIALQNRWTTVNEVRALEDMPPVPWGDEPNDSGSSGADVTEEGNDDDVA